MVHQEKPNNSEGDRRGHIPALCVSFIQKLQSNNQPQLNEVNKANDVLIRYTRQLACATWVIAGVGGLSIVAALLQWNALKSTDRATHVAAKAAQDAANAAIAANDTTRAQLAAYLTIQVPQTTITIGNDGKVAVDLYIRNTGGTSARELYLNVRPLIKQGTVVNFDVSEGGGPLEVPTKEPWHHIFDFGKNPAFSLSPTGGNIFVTAKVAMHYETLFKESISQTIELIGQYEDPIICCNIEQLKSGVPLLRDFDPTRIPNMGR